MVKADSSKKTKKSFKYKLPLFVVVIILLSIFGYLAYKELYKDSGHNKASSETDTLRSGESRQNKIYEELLKNKDYEGYQNGLNTDVDAYIYRNDYADAERLLNTALQKVPSEKINTNTYRKLNALYKANGNKANYNKYTKLLISKLKQEGSAKEATLYEEQLKESQ